MSYVLQYVVHPHDTLACRNITPKRVAQYLCTSDSFLRCTASTAATDNRDPELTEWRRESQGRFT